MRRTVPAAVFIAFLILVPGCGRKLTDPSIPLDLAPEEEFELVVSADGDTGYHWELLRTLDQTVLRFVERQYEGSGLSLSSPGNAGCEIWRFRAVGEGETTIEMGYMVPPGVEFSVQDSVLVYAVRVIR